MAIDALSAFNTSTALSAYAAMRSIGETSQTLQASAATSGAFSLDLAGQVDQVQTLQDNASTLAVRAVTGDLDDIHDYTIAASEASVALELTAALRNKAVEAFTEIMRMQA